MRKYTWNVRPVDHQHPARERLPIRGQDVRGHRAAAQRGRARTRPTHAEVRKHRDAGVRRRLAQTGDEMSTDGDGGNTALGSDFTSVYLSTHEIRVHYC